MEEIWFYRFVRLLRDDYTAVFSLVPSKLSFFVYKVAEVSLIIVKGITCKN